MVKIFWSIITSLLFNFYLNKKILFKNLINNKTVNNSHYFIKSFLLLYLLKYKLIKIIANATHKIGLEKYFLMEAFKVKGTYDRNF